MTDEERPIRPLKLKVMSRPPLTIRVIGNLGADPIYANKDRKLPGYRANKDGVQLHWATLFGAFNASYYSSIGYIKNLVNEDYTASRVGVFPYVVTPRGNLYLVAYKKKTTRWCRGCVGDLGGGVRLRNNIYEILKKEIHEELSANHGVANRRLTDHIISELEKTDRIHTSRQYRIYCSNIPFGISLETVSYFNGAAQNKSQKETSSSHYKIIYNQILVPIDGDYINIKELNDNIAKDQENETSHLRLVDEPTFIRFFTDPSAEVDANYNTSMQILKKVGFIGIPHPCRVPYRELYESVKERALNSYYYHKYGRDELIRRLDQSDYTRLCYLYQKLSQ